MITICLKQLLDDRGMSQAELSRQAGVRPNTVCNMCSNKSLVLRVDYIDSICGVLKCDVSDLLKHSDE